MLTAVTEPGGTAMEAAVDGYLVAGKTGTAQKADYVHGGYAKDKWLASFIGFAPAERPAVVISVVIDEPVIAHYGGTVAGPVFRRIAEVTLRHMGIAPEGRQAVLAKKKEQQIAVVEAEPAPEEEAVEKGRERRARRALASVAAGGHRAARRVAGGGGRRLRGRGLARARAGQGGCPRLGGPTSARASALRRRRGGSDARRRRSLRRYPGGRMPPEPRQA